MHRYAKILIVVLAAPLALDTMSCTTGGCYWTQNNFKVMPAESCVHLIHDVCGNSSIVLENDCAEALVVQQRPGDAASNPLTIESGSSGTVIVTDFTDKKGHVSIPAQLGSTDVVISWDIGWQ